MTDVIVFRAPMRKDVYHTRECPAIANRDGTRKEVPKEYAERMGLRECSRCNKTGGRATKDKWRKSLKRMINDGDIDV
jgi:methylphosphotriester-DNA--protein-cysteine methyltransferase